MPLITGAAAANFLKQFAFRTVMRTPTGTCVGPLFLITPFFSLQSLGDFLFASPQQLHSTALAACVAYRLVLPMPCEHNESDRTNSRMHPYKHRQAYPRLDSSRLVSPTRCIPPPRRLAAMGRWIQQSNKSTVGILAGRHLLQ